MRILPLPIPTLSKITTLALLVTILGCTAKNTSQLKASEETPLGLNDVAIMMPYETRPELLADSLKADAFIPVEAMSEIDKILADDRAIHEHEAFAFGPIGDLEFERNILKLAAPESETPFRMVSMRVDPCGNFLTKKDTGASCHHEVRIVWQPLALVEGVPTTKDINLHSIYHLDELSFARFVQGLRNLRRTAGPAPKDEALLPHPIIAQEGAGGAYYQGLISLIKAEVGPHNLARIAFFADTNPNFLGHWPFVAFDFENGLIVRNPSPVLGKQEGEIQKLVQRIEGAPRRLGEPFPKGDFEHNLFPAFPEPTSDDEAFLDALYNTYLTNKFSNAVALENPELHEPANADCASCHMAVIGKFNTAMELEARDTELPKLAFQSDHFNLHTDVTAQFSQTSLQIFSYFQSRSKIAQRAVNDAALSADRLNAGY